MMARLRSALADAEWMNADRARGYGLIFVAANIGIILIGLLMSKSGIDPTGKPLGTDFTSFWAAARLAASGQSAAAWDMTAHAAAERAIFDGQDRGYAAFFYPPLFLMYLLPLGFLPYGAALAAWLAVTGLACWRAITRWLPRPSWAMLAYPATFLTIGHGQNAFLTTALFGAGTWLMDRRPWLAGACFGAMAYKPQLGLLIPVLLIATGRWRVFVAAALTVLALAAASVILFGAEGWSAFLAGSSTARAALESNLVGHEKMVSLYAALRLVGAPGALAWAGQGAITLAALAAVIHSRNSDSGSQAALLITASVLATPFLLDYDLMLLAIPMAWLLATGQRTGFLAHEKSALMAAFLLPMLHRPLALATGVPIAPIVLVALFAILLRRAKSLVFSAKLP